MPDASAVLAIVVTHNRLELLKRCLYHLRQQTARPDILVINNGSSDGTAEYLQAEGIDCYTQGNEGSAGGWYRGIDEAQKRGYKYVWMMDDDGFPDHSALALLLTQMNDEVACVSSAVVKENQRNEFVFGFPALNKSGFPKLLAAKRKFQTLEEVAPFGDTYPFTFLFNGALVNLKHATAIGNIVREYFMYGDEVDYFCRMRKSGKVFTYFKALHYHPDVNNRVIEKKRVYYFIRNTIILNNAFFDVPAARNVLTLGVALARIAGRNGVKDSLSYLVGSNAKYFYPAITDGLRRRFNNRY